METLKTLGAGVLVVCGILVAFTVLFAVMEWVWQHGVLSYIRDMGKAWHDGCIISQTEFDGKVREEIEKKKEEEKCSSQP